MAIVTITGNAWDNTGGPLPADIAPQLWVIPDRARVSDSALIAGVEVLADLDVASGAFTADVFAAPDLRYRFMLRWLVNPREPNPEKWAYGRAYWDFTFNPYPDGGPLELFVDIPDLTAYSVLVSLDDPPSGYRGWYLNAPGPGLPPGDPDDPESSGTGILEIVS